MAHVSDAPQRDVHYPHRQVVAVAARLLGRQLPILRTKATCCQQAAKARWHDCSWQLTGPAHALDTTAFGGAALHCCRSRTVSEHSRHSTRQPAVPCCRLCTASAHKLPSHARIALLYAQVESAGRHLGMRSWRTAGQRVLPGRQRPAAAGRATCSTVVVGLHASTDASLPLQFSGWQA